MITMQAAAKVPHYNIDILAYRCLHSFLSVPFLDSNGLQAEGRLDQVTIRERRAVH